jgi:histidyl-tRNA synthetase
MSKKTNLSLDPYKGTRDFYPEDQFVEDYIFSVMQRVVQRYGYEPYNASILEEAALYRAKSGEEIVNEQTYTFTDRGEDTDDGDNHEELDECKTFSH